METYSDSDSFDLRLRATGATTRFTAASIRIAAIVMEKGEDANNTKLL